MKNYHPIGQPFKVTLFNGEQETIVARECETFHDKQWNQDFRKTCKGCVFCYIKGGWCSGHRYFEEACTWGGYKNAKCSPEYREDGKFIHYKKIVTK